MTGSEANKTFKIKTKSGSKIPQHAIRCRNFETECSLWFELKYPLPAKVPSKFEIHALKLSHLSSCIGTPGQFGSCDQQGH